MNLTAHIARHPIADEAYLRHLRTADVFNEVWETRDALIVAEQAACVAQDEIEAIINRHDRIIADKSTQYEAALAKAAIMQALEDL